MFLKNNDTFVSTMTKLINFWMHPNALVRNQCVKSITLLLKPKHVSFLYCKVLPIVNKYLSSPTLLKMKNEKDLKNYLATNVSRFCFDLATNKFKFTNNEPFNFSLQDRHVLWLIPDIINTIPKQQANENTIDLKSIKVDDKGYKPK